MCRVKSGACRQLMRTSAGHIPFFTTLDIQSYFSYIVKQMPQDSLGQFEQLVLTAVIRLGNNAYGVTIHDKVSQMSAPRRVSLGSVYVTLDRLEDKGYISSKLSDPTPERGGRSKRCYVIQAAGEQALQESAITARRMWDELAEAFGREIGQWKHAGLK